MLIFNITANSFAKIISAFFTGVISPGYDKSTPFSVALNSNNNNNNNNGDSGNHMTESRISSYSSRDPISTRQGGRAGAGPRKKSALVQSMAANFEQKKGECIFMI